MTCFGCLCMVARGVATSQEEISCFVEFGVSHCMRTYLNTGVAFNSKNLFWGKRKPPKCANGGRYLCLSDSHNLLVLLSRTSIAQDRAYTSAEIEPDNYYTTLYVSIKYIS